MIVYYAMFWFMLCVWGAIIDDDKFIQTRQHRVWGFILVSLPLYGRIFGWW